MFSTVPNHFHSTQEIIFMPKTDLKCSKFSRPSESKNQFTNGFQKLTNQHQFRSSSSILVQIYYQPQRSCGQGNIFTPVCHSVHGGVSSRESPPCQGDPPGPDPTPPDQNPPGKQTAAYGQRVASTHPTGMHSCSNKLQYNIVAVRINAFITSYVIDFAGPMRFLNILNSIDNNQNTV